MSQQGVENLVGRLITDAVFRLRFFQTPEQIVSQESLDLIPRELEAVLLMDRAQVEDLARHLDPRIVRADTARKSRGSGRMHTRDTLPIAKVSSRQSR